MGDVLTGVCSYPFEVLVLMDNDGRHACIRGQWVAIRRPVMRADVERVGAVAVVEAIDPPAEVVHATPEARALVERLFPNLGH